MTDPHFQRAQLLVQQGRFDLAADALRQTLAQSPQNAVAHALLGLCLVQQKHYDDATVEAQTAIFQEPDNAFCHYILGAVFQERNRFPEAEQAAREAVRLAPENPDYWSLLAQTFVARQRWREALDAADSGLQFDPAHNACVNLRAVALVKLGDREAAAQSISGALQRNPHSALSHANQGWTLLHQNDPKQALEHFREALRLNPNNEWAREGTMEALKARHLLYRLMLRYYLWMSRFSRQGQWGIIIGLWLGMQLLQAIRASRPDLAPFIYPLLGAYAVFALSSWLAVPVFNLTLLLNPFGRHLLSTIQTIGALLVGSLLLGAAILIPLGLYAHNDLMISLGLLLAILTLPVATTIKCRPGWPLALMSAYTLATAAAGITTIVLWQMGRAEGDTFFLATVWACALSGLAANILLSMIKKK